LAADFGKAITEMTTDGSFDTILTNAIQAWDDANPPKE
jgi:hypothetical protein